MKKTAKTTEQIFSVCVILFLAVLTLTFLYLYINACGGLLVKNQVLYCSIGTVLIAVLTAMAIIYQLMDKSFIYRLVLMLLLIASILLILLYALKISGFWDKVDSPSDLREFIASAGSYAIVFFLVLQVLQVVILPIPGIVMIGAGTLLFGAFKGAVLSFIGIMLGSLFGFFVGKVLGYRGAKWLVGDGLDKTLETMKGRDKIILTFMFLFPFFPDDILCFVSGLSSMTTKYFIIMISITRFISIFFTSFSVSGHLIPYNTWWGLAIWGVVFVLTIVASVYIYKNGDRVEKFFKEKFVKK